VSTLNFGTKLNLNDLKDVKFCGRNKYVCAHSDRMLEVIQLSNDNIDENKECAIS